MSHYRPKDGKDGIPGTNGKDGERGPIGPMPEHEWIGTNLRFQEPSGEWGEFVDLEGPKGEKGDPGQDGADGRDGADGKDGARGPQGESGNDGEPGVDGARGPVGPIPDHQWSGTKLRFEEPDGDWGKYVDLKGEKGDQGPSGVGARGPKGEKGDSADLEEGPGIDLVTGTDGITEVSFDADTAEIAHLPGATYTTVQKLIDVLFSPGIITGGEVTELNPTTARVNGGTAIIRIADDNVSRLVMCDFSSADFSLATTQTTNFYALDYSGGNPVLVSALSDTWDRDTQIPVGSAFRLDGALNVTSNAYRVGDILTNLLQRADAVGPVLRDASVGGLLVGNVATRRVTVTAGRLWSRVSDFTVTAKNSSVDPMFSAYFNGTNLTVTSGLGQWDNLNFNNMGTGALVPMGNNKFANIWIFISFDGTKYGFAYGTAEHNTVGAAANEGIPAYLTQNFFNQALLLGRFIFEKGVDLPVRIESAFTALFNTSAINDHNQLSGIQDAPNAVANEHYHLSSAQATAVANAVGTGGGFVTVAGAQNVTGAKTFTADLAVSGATISQVGTVTAQTSLASITGTLANSNTTQQQIFFGSPQIQPSGASLTSLFGLIFLPSLSGGNAAIGGCDLVFARLSTTAGFTGTLTSINTFRAGAPSGPTLPTTYRGLLVDNYTAGTNTRGIDLMISSGSGKHNIYAQGTADNYLEGSLGIGTSTPTLAKLQVNGNASPHTDNTFTNGLQTRRWSNTFTRDLTVGPASASLGGGVGVMFLGNATTVPTSNPTGGAIMYAEAGAAKVRGTSGTITTFGPADPHCPRCGSDFVREYDSAVYGYLARCDNCAADGINSHTRIKGEWSMH